LGVGIFASAGSIPRVFILAATVFLLLVGARQSCVERKNWLRADGSIWWLLALLTTSLILYVVKFSTNSETGEAFILLTGAVLGKIATLWILRQVERPFSESILRIIIPLAFMISAASVWHPEGVVNFQYRHEERWSGPWNDPNIYGLLMGTGFVMSIGLVLLNSVVCRSPSIRWHNIRFLLWPLFLLQALVCSIGLERSFSRAAWLGTACGLAYLVWSKTQSRRSKVQTLWISWLTKNWIPLPIILVSVFVLSFWHFKQTDWHPAQRIFSTVNAVDFSWRNRVAAWEGALQIAAEHPWFGTGWNQPEPLYEHYYLSPKLNESAAIELNDYLMLGATLGIPALLCFGMYIWLSLTRRAKVKSQNPESLTTDWLQTTCRASAIVLLVGFWFDGGLFKLPTAATFWILLELGAVGLPQNIARQTNEVF
jgi:O-antigen ligase